MVMVMVMVMVIILKKFLSISNNKVVQSLTNLPKFICLFLVQQKNELISLKS